MQNIEQSNLTNNKLYLQLLTKNTYYQNLINLLLHHILNHLTLQNSTDFNSFKNSLFSSLHIIRKI